MIGICVYVLAVDGGLIRRGVVVVGEGGGRERERESLQRHFPLPQSCFFLFAGVTSETCHRVSLNSFPAVSVDEAVTRTLSDTLSDTHVRPHTLAGWSR